MNTYRISELQTLLGSNLGSSEWVSVDQARIDQFAAVTGDHQWIHVDTERAAAGPFGTTVAHGFLTLSLVPVMVGMAFKVSEVRMSVNYGLNRARFTAPVPAGSRVRARFAIQAVELLDDACQVVWAVTMEGEGSDKPVCIAELITRHYH